MVLASQSLSNLTAEQLRELASELLSQVARHDESIARQDQELQRKDGELKYRQAKIDQLTHEMAVLKRLEVWPQPRAAGPRATQLARRDH